MIKLFLATSSFQKRPMDFAIQELMELSPFGLQLCAGNLGLRDKNYKEYFDNNKINYLIHHNFSWTNSLRIDTWIIKDNKLKFNATESNSVHPPMKFDVPDEQMFWDYIYENKNNDTIPILETMYPNEYYLSNDEELNRIMDLNLKIAVDISHIYIQFYKKSISEETWERLQNYNHIKEIHVSSNQGRHDSHQPLKNNTFGLKWAKDYAYYKDIPLVLECYMHKMTKEEKINQINLILK